MSVEIRQVSRFDQVRFRGPGTLKITQGDKESLTVHAPAYVMKHIESKVKDTVLCLGYVAPKIVSLRVNREVISYDLCMKDVRKLVLTGIGRLVVPDLDNDVVTVELMGAGKVSLDKLTADRLDVMISGSGNVRVAGDVEAQTLVISGSGNYDAERLVSDFAQVRISGSGNASVSVSDDLNVVISGSGKVSYGGYPDISKFISGSGKLLRRRRKQQLNKGEEHG
jgi:Putative auto-transporter adhesin, head GIN domain